MLAIVPNVLKEAINKKLDAAIALVPEAARERDRLYNMLLDYFDEHGELPCFEIVKKNKEE